MKKRRISEITITGLVKEQNNVLADINNIPFRVPIESLLGRLTMIGNKMGTDINTYDANELNKHLGAGLTLILLPTTNYQNLPVPLGVLLHIQRLMKNDNSTSQQIYQALFSYPEIYYRSGIGNGTNITFNSWKRFVLQ